MNEQLDREDGEEYVSKSQLKREMHALQEMGKTLVELPEGKLRKIPMPPELQEAGAEGRRLTKREARRRHLQFIGKMMRNIDVEPIREALEVMDGQSQAHRQQFHQLENWRDLVVANDPDIIETLLERFPQADRQQLRNLQRQAIREAEQKKPPAASRKLFAYLRELAGS